MLFLVKSDIGLICMNDGIIHHPEGRRKCQHQNQYGKKNGQTFPPDS